VRLSRHLTAPARRWSRALAIYAVALAGLLAVQAPSPPLFAALVAGIALAVMARPPTPPLWWRRTGLTLVGVIAGAGINSEIVSTVLYEPLAVVGGVVATLAATLAIGQLLRLGSGVTPATAAFASVAGGASGVSLIAKEFGADAAVVLSAQYLRVVLVLISIPLISPFFCGHSCTANSSGAPDGSSSLLFVVAAGAVGAALTHFARFAGASILVPLLVSSALSASGWFGDVTVPNWIAFIAFTIVGTDVGLGFTQEKLRSLRRVLPLILLQISLSIAACAGIGLVFAALTDVSAMTGYLATTPGGLPAVVAIAAQAGDVGLVVAMQVVRVLLSLAISPLIGRWLGGGSDPPHG
jgi:membrane AbrB-like protein